jgi:hypothetical protein
MEWHFQESCRSDVPPSNFQVSSFVFFSVLFTDDIRLYRVDDREKEVEHWQNNTDRVLPNYPEKILSHYRFVHRESRFY